MKGMTSKRHFSHPILQKYKQTFHQILTSVLPQEKHLRQLISISKRGIASLSKEQYRETSDDIRSLKKEDDDSREPLKMENVTKGFKYSQTS